MLGSTPPPWRKKRRSSTGNLVETSEPTLSMPCHSDAFAFRHRRIGTAHEMKDYNAQVFHVSLAEALAKGPPPPGNLAVPIFAHGSLEAELYTPKLIDPQKPHRRDELYVVTRGSG